MMTPRLVTRGESAKHQKIAPYRIQKTPKKSIRKGAFLRQKTTQNTDTEEKQKKSQCNHKLAIEVVTTGGYNVTTDGYRVKT